MVTRSSHRDNALLALAWGMKSVEEIGGQRQEQVNFIQRKGNNNLEWCTVQLLATEAIDCPRCGVMSRRESRIESLS